MPESALTNKGYGVSFATPVENSKDLLLLSLDESLVIDTDFSLREDTLLQNVFSQNESFFYKIECFDKSNPPKTLLFAERGIGEILLIGGKYYLHRDTVTHFEDAQGERSTSSQISFLNNTFIVCYTYTSENIFDLLFYPNSLVCSSSGNTAIPVQLQNNTLLGRLNDSIQSLDIDELRQIFTDAIIRGIIESSTGNYTFLCQTLNLANSNSRLSSAALQARPVYNTSNRPAPQRGSIIYNEQTNRFEGYDGTAWRPFAWASGIGPPYDNT